MTLLAPFILAAEAPAHGTGGTARDLLIILATAGLVALLLRRLKVATIPGYLIAGAIIGPSAIALIRSGDSVEAISQLSTILLMFTIGLHMDVPSARAGLASIAGVTLVSTAAGILLGWPIALAFGFTGPAALVASGALAMSSTAVVIRFLEQRRELHSAPGRLTFGIVLFQDLVALALLAGLPAMEMWSRSAGATAGEAARAALDRTVSDPVALLSRASLAIGGISAMIVIGRWFLPRLLKEAAGGAGDFGGEVLLVVSAAVALGAAVLTAWLGFSPELGAFLAGFLLASTPFRFQLAGQLAPLRDLFLAVFFTSVGLRLPLGEVAAAWWAVLLAVGATVVIKSLAIGVSSYAFGASARVAAITGLALAQGGEFSLVLMAQAVDRHILTQSQTGYLVAVVVLTIMVTPWLFTLGQEVGDRLSRVRPAPWLKRAALCAEPGVPDAREGAQAAGTGGEGEKAKPAGRAVVAGFGPVGRAVADRLEKSGVEIAVIELNPRTVERQALLGRRVVYGDASNPEVLASAGLMVADAVILTMPDEQAMLRACRVVRSMKRDVFIAVRANALSRGLQAMQLGADHAVIEELATAEAMAEQVMLKLDQRAAGVDGPRLYEFDPDARLSRASRAGDLPG